MSTEGLINPLFQWAVFVGSALTALFCSIMMVTRRNPIHSALWLIVTFFSLAIIYLTLSAQFIAVAQVIVYAGRHDALVFVICSSISKASIPSGWLSGAKVMTASSRPSSSEVAAAVSPSARA
jgi:NADH:ubiquinone oxidoreductase subunit 6 (subunit J)